MITLYENTETEFATQGLGALHEATSVKVTEVLNGLYELTMIYPITGKRANDLIQTRYIKCKHDPFEDPQPFEIYRVTKTLKSTLKVYARHISYKLNKYTVTPFQSTGILEAFKDLKNHIVGSCPFTFSTDKDVSSTFKVVVPSTVRDCLGGKEGSFLDTFKGEYEWDYFRVYLHTHRGEDKGVTIRYGKNLTSMKHETNVSNMYTGVQPYWTGTNESGETITKTLSSNVVWSEYYQLYPYPMVMPLDLSSKFDTIPTDAQLQSAAESYIESNNIGTPKLNVDFDFIALRQTKEYGDIAPLEMVQLGDTVTVTFPYLDVVSRARVVKVVYDALTDRYDSVEIGSVTSSLASTVSNQSKTIEQNDIDTRSYFSKEIEKATNTLKGAYGGHLVIGTDANGEPNALYVMDTTDISTAVKIIVLNEEGMGFSTNGFAGPYNMAFLIDGTADMQNLNVVNLMANVITGGLLMDQKGKNWWNLDTGELHIGGSNEELDNLSSEVETINESLAPFQTTDYGVVIDESTTIGGGIVVTDTVSVRNTMQIGNHVWLARSNGTNTTLVYVGD